MENILNFLVSDVGSIISTALTFVYTLFFLLFMHFSAKHRNYKLSPGWYIAGFVFPVITALVFLSKRKRFPGPNMKVCPICGDKYPEVYQVCGRCLIELPENKEEEKQKEKTLSKAFGWLFTVIYIVTSVITITVTAFTVKYMFDSLGGLDNILNYSMRISCTAEDGSKVFYDKEGNAYENEKDVVIYGKDGETYVYDEETTKVDEYGDSEPCYVSSKGDTYFYYNCYVDQDGYFFYDENYELYYPDEAYDDYYDAETQEGEDTAEDKGTFKELVDLYVGEFFGSVAEYRYYDDYLVDEDGKIYYWAEEASWNAEGELITAENDPHPVVK